MMPFDIHRTIPRMTDEVKRSDRTNQWKRGIVGSWMDSTPGQNNDCTTN